MKRKILTLIGLVLILAGVASAQNFKLKYNPFTRTFDYYDSTVGLATLANPSFTGTVKSAGPLELGPLGRNLKTWWAFEDFTARIGAVLNEPWFVSVSGTAAYGVPIVSTALRPGIFGFETGSTNAGIASLSTGGTDSGIQFLFGAGTYTLEADIYLEYLSTATETYTLRFGFGDVYNAIPVDGAYFRYTDVGGGTPTPNWYKCTISNTSGTATDTGVAAVAAAWTRLKVVVNAAGTSVEYFINGVSVGVMTNTIPTGTGRQTGAVVHIIKSAGTTTRIVQIDWIWLHIDLTTSR